MDLDEYGSIPFKYKTDKILKLEKISNGLGGMLLSTQNIYYEKDFGSSVSRWKETFDLTNWKIFGAYDGEKLIAGCVVAIKTNNVHMLEDRDDLAVLWDLRVSEEYKYKGIGQKLFDMAKKFVVDNNFNQLKVECQNTNYSAVKFYHKQGMSLAAIKEQAYKDHPSEIQLIWYLNLK
jgi:ribosomal protein S18 acetylase RimI-like enzyme